VQSCPGVRRVIRRLLNLWATRSLLVGGVATVVDVSCMVTAVEWLGWPRVPAAMLGVSVGATVSFLLNKYFAFRDHESKLGPQALRYAAATGGAMLVHASFMFVLTTMLGVFYVISKFIADLVVFSGGNLLLMRFIVFPRAAKVMEAVSASEEDGEEAASLV
jgi:putative flippase GtrA